MAEGGPSSSIASPPATPPPAQRASRIHFPGDQAQLTTTDSSPYGSIQSIGLGTPPVLRKSSVQGGSLPFQQDDKRRRVKSVDTSNGFEQLRLQHSHPSSPSRRTMSFNRRAEKRESVSKAVSNGLPEAFSDEFDLSREDPGVLEDVQRALRLKARREARLRTQPSPLRVESRGISDVASLSSVSASSSPGPPPAAVPPLSRAPHVFGDSEIDFSPSVGVMPLHPVPSSSDGGSTLDWSTPVFEDGRERRWSISLAKRKPREPASFSSNKAVIEKQEALYTSKLDQIRSTIQPQTQRKAVIVRDQLRRKYELLSSGRKSPEVSILDVVRWYHKQDATTRSRLDDAEPSAWMKHLWDKHAPPRGGNSTWSPTAFVMEDYVRSHFGSHAMDTIYENEVILSGSPHASFSEVRSPTTSSYSWTTPRHSLEAAISRKRSSYDAQVSFEPLVESGRDSIGPDSRRSSDNYKNWKTGAGNSAPSSLYSIISKSASPNSSHKRIGDAGKRPNSRLSDEALSSARNSVSENSGHSASEDGAHFGHQKIATVHPRSRPASLHLQPPPMPKDPLDVNFSASSSALPDVSEPPTTATQSSTVFPSAAEPTPRPDVSTENAIAPATLPRRRFRRSLPSSIDVFVREREKRQRSANEQKEREEYEVKAQVLEDTLSQNYRMRHLLQRVCTSIREYDSVQEGLSSLVGTSYTKIPSAVLDAFLHDPSAVTGRTRRAKSWRAVEDIHHRIQRQRETLQSFLCSQLLDGGAVPISHKVFDDPVTKLIRTLDQLAAQREDLVHRAEEVTTALKHVKTVQAEVKRNYNDTLAHTSLVYPELSQIAALEENYRNQYQRFWDVGLDALTFLLDTVTPFWRNYGKVIGEDVQDFLIVPWYRNEFTGEPRRYPVQQFPRRSLRHWAGLLLLSLLSISITVLQTRAAISLSVNISLPWVTNASLWWIAIPIYLILLLIQWCAVLIEYCILAAQTGVIIWWLGWSLNLVS